jgi:hypothetical protein
MAQRSLAVLTHPSFPQVFAQALNQEVTRVAPQLSVCCYESPESYWGACDGGIRCTRTATIHDVATEQDYCFAHYREVRRG